MQSVASAFGAGAGAAFAVWTLTNSPFSFANLRLGFVSRRLADSGFCRRTRGEGGVAFTFGVAFAFGAAGVAFGSGVVFWAGTVKPPPPWMSVEELERWL